MIKPCRSPSALSYCPVPARYSHADHHLSRRRHVPPPVKSDADCYDAKRPFASRLHMALLRQGKPVVKPGDIRVEIKNEPRGGARPSQLCDTYWHYGKIMASLRATTGASTAAQVRVKEETADVQLTSPKRASNATGPRKTIIRLPKSCTVPARKKTPKTAKHSSLKAHGNVKISKNSYASTIHVVTSTKHAVSSTEQTGSVATETISSAAATTSTSSKQSVTPAEKHLKQAS